MATKHGPSVWTALPSPAASSLLPSLPAAVVPLPVVVARAPIVVVDDALRRRDHRKHVLNLLLLVLMREHVAVMHLCLSDDKVREWIISILDIRQVAILLPDVWPE